MKKPGQYLDSEFNAIQKKDAPVRSVLIYPDLYEIGLSNLGLQILYFLGNSLEYAVVDRAYAPDVDMADLIRSGRAELCGVETGIALKEFDILGFTLQSELTFTNILYMLDLAGIPFRSADRRDNFPLIIAGGPAAFNPAPLSPFIDVFVIGDGEKPFLKILEIAHELKKKEGSLPRQKILELIEDEVEGAFIPSFYEWIYDENGTLREIKKVGGNPNKYKVRRSFLSDLSELENISKQLVPLVSISHERAQLEIARGCRRGCRFCQASFIYRPVREFGAEELAKKAQNLLLNTGYEELSLVSLSTSDYSDIERLLNLLEEFCTKRRITISLPSLRMDGFSVKLAGLVSTGRKATITFAPEGGTERIRAVINKNLKEEEIRSALEAAFSSGYQKIKLYFMIGLPTERDEDLIGIADIINTAYETGRKLLPSHLRGKLRINVSVSTFVPKSHTPFQWEKQIDEEEARRKADLIRSAIYFRNIKLSFHDHRQAVLEGLIARGDTRVGYMIKEAYLKGAIFDGWDDRFKFEIWKSVVPDFSQYLKERDIDELLPWDPVDCGVDTQFLKRERERAYSTVQTEPCRQGCLKCGICKEVKIIESKSL